MIERKRSPKGGIPRSLLDHPEAQALVNDATLTPATVRGCADRLTAFLQRSLPKFYRLEQRRNATPVIRGLRSGLERRTCEPIAIQARLPRQPLDRSLPGLPQGWIRGGDEFGRVAKFRAPWRRRRERDVLDVPCNTSMRALELRPPRRRKKGRGRKPKVPFQRVDVWAKSQPESRWARLTVRDAAKGPLEVDVLRVRVQTKQDCRLGPEERLIVPRAGGKSRVDDALSKAGPEVPVAELVGVQRQRHRVQEMFEAGKGEAGLAHDEVRSGIGWHHHMTLALLALWFLCLERWREGGKSPTLTVSQMRQVFRRLLRNPPPKPAAIAAAVTRVLRRNAEARIYHWFAAKGTFSPHRSRPASSNTSHPP
jgi:hypothetical protein